MRAKRWIPTIGVIVTALTSGITLLWPGVVETTSQESMSVIGGPTITGSVVTKRSSLLRDQGVSALPAVLIPLLIAWMPLAVAKTRWAIPASFAAALLMSAFVFVAGFSIGFAYVPATLMMLVGATGLAIMASWEWWRRRTDTTTPGANPGATP